MGKAIKTIVILIVIGAALYFGAQFFMKDDTAPTSGLVSSNGDGALVADDTPGSEDIGGEFVTLLLNMKTIKLDEGFFQSSSFKALQDFSTSIQPENNQGRINPFAPIGQDGGSAAPATTPAAATAGTGASAGATPPAPRP